MFVWLVALWLYAFPLAHTPPALHVLGLTCWPTPAPLHRESPLAKNPLDGRGLFQNCAGAGVGQQIKPRTCRAGGVWVRWSAYSHKATSQTNLNESPQHLAGPLSTGGHTTLPPCGVPTKFV
jgi:hypothetical protein